MAYWLLKSEPFKYPFSRLVQEGVTDWDGVRNYQAANNLRQMAVGDQAFFYHSNEGREIVGIVAITHTAMPDPSDASGRFVMVRVKPVAAFPHPVGLHTLKSDPGLQGLALLKQPRLSVCPISAEAWQHIVEYSKAPQAGEK